MAEHEQDKEKEKENPYLNRHNVYEYITRTLQHSPKYSF